MTSANRRIQAVIFDLDDTLISWAEAGPWQERSPIYFGRIYHRLAAYGCDLPDEEIFINSALATIKRAWAEARQTYVAPAIGTIVKTCLDYLGINYDGIDINELLIAYGWGPVPGVKLYHDTLPLLAALRARNYKIGLITNSALTMWMRDVEMYHYGLMPYFDARITSGDTGYIKPHPHIYQHILQLLNVQPKEAVFVGDNPAFDILGANNAGLTSIWIDPPHLNRDLGTVKPDFTIQYPGQILSILDHLD
ncbi:MAG TPA: HAD family hydrolase [Anaerolineae bacterium]|nr:HAD family hydrolase [Anaerolineae bacterium]